MTTQPETLVTQEMQDTKDVWSEPRVSWTVSSTDIRKWAQAVYWPEVPPRIYWDEEYAKGTKWGGIIAPQEFNPFAWPLEGSYGQAQSLAEVLGTPPPETGRPMGSGPGSNAMNGGQTVTYHAPIRPGDVITATTALVDWNERETRLGLTMFVTNETRWTNQHGELVNTDEALRYDLEMIKKFGFNMVRKHIKVEPYRWYYWADKLGLLVWQDMPSPNSYTAKVPPVDTTAFRSELTRMIRTHWNSPSIITWVVFNEGQAQHNTPALVNMVKKLDPSRLVNQASGGEHFSAGDYLDIHAYPPPAVPYSTAQVLACGEYGGIGFIIPGHTWKIGDTYIMINNKKEYTDLYDKFATDLTLYKTNMGLSAAVYTEITDVEIELNGLLTYDREINKGGTEKILASNLKAINDNLYLKEVLASSQKQARSWKYTTTAPTGDWFGESFNDATWKTGQAGFGSRGTPGGNIKTIWNTKDIWLRQEFTLGSLSAEDKNKLSLYIHHDEDCEVYINGVLAATISGYTSAYTVAPLNAEGKAAIKADGKNVIAIHCKQTAGGQYIDAGLSLLSNTKLN